MNKEKVQQAYERWAKQKTRGNMSILLKELDPMVSAVSVAHGAAGDSNVKWAARAYLAQQLSQRYDPTKSNLSTFTYQTLQRIPRIAAKQRNVVSVPESSDHDMRYLRGIKEDLFDELGREPSDIELADRSGVDIHRIENLSKRFARPIVTASQMAETTGMPVGAAEEESDSSPDEQLWKEYAVQAMDPTDLKIYNWLSKSNPMSKIDIAKKLNVSPSAVTQRASRIGQELGGYGD